MFLNLGYQLDINTLHNNRVGVFKYSFMVSIVYLSLIALARQNGEPGVGVNVKLLRIPVKGFIQLSLEFLKFFRAGRSIVLS